MREGASAGGECALNTCWPVCICNCWKWPWKRLSSLGIDVWYWSRLIPAQHRPAEFQFCQTLLKDSRHKEWMAAYLITTIHEGGEGHDPYSGF